MSNEQWIIYLYGIYPTGGWSFLWGVLLLVTFIVLIPITVDHFATDESEQKNTVYTGLGNWKWILPSVLIFFLFLSSLVPSKNVFLTLVATPTIMEQFNASSTDGKLMKLNNIIDLVLDKAAKDLNSEKD